MTRTLTNAIRLALITICPHRLHWHGPGPYAARCKKCGTAWESVSAHDCPLPHVRRIPKGCHFS